MSDTPAATTDVSGGATVAAPPAAQPALVSTVAPAADTAPRIDMASFKAAFDEKADMMIVDVRTPDGFAAGHIPGAVNIPEAEVGARMAEMPKDARIVLYCA
jgi:rhodanese-related sulfurtransferase